MREMRQALACLCEAYTVRMATTPQMTFSSQSQQLTWCCLRGRCNSWFLQNGPHRDSGHLTSSRKRGAQSKQGGDTCGASLPSQCGVNARGSRELCTRDSPGLLRDPKQGH